MVVGEKRKFLSALVTLKSLVDSAGVPTDQLSAEAIDYLRGGGASSAHAARIKCAGVTETSVADILRNPAKTAALVQAGLDRVNAKAASEAYKVLKFDILPADFATVTGELGPTFRLQRLIVAKKVWDRMHWHV